MTKSPWPQYAATVDVDEAEKVLASAEIDLSNAKTSLASLRARRAATEAEVATAEALVESKALGLVTADGAKANKEFSAATESLAAARARMSAIDIIAIPAGEARVAELATAVEKATATYNLGRMQVLGLEMIDRDREVFEALMRVEIAIEAAKAVRADICRLPGSDELIQSNRKPLGIGLLARGIRGELSALFQLRAPGAIGLTDPGPFSFYTFSLADAEPDRAAA